MVNCFLVLSKSDPNPVYLWKTKTCFSSIPGYPNLTGDTFICPVTGAVAGETYVSGDVYLQASFQYSYSHIWRNLGILIGFYVFFLLSYLVASELNSSQSSAADVPVSRRKRKSQAVSGTLQCAQEGQEPSIREKAKAGGEVLPALETTRGQGSIFTWRDVVYDIRIKDEPRRLLDHVSGWVKPGTLTALMGVSGAGKTTLLDVLAQRTSIGIITGDMLVDGKPLDPSFQRKTGMP